MAHQITANNDQGHTRGSHVFLCARINQSIARDVDGSGHDVGGHVSNEGHIACVGRPMALHATNGFVATKMHIGRLF